jgi:hypothetical protein
MSSPLYSGEITAKRGATVRYRLALVHPDENRFGTDRLFAWKLLSHWVSPPDQGDDRALAAKYVERVTLSPLKNGTITRTTANALEVQRIDWEKYRWRHWRVSGSESSRNGSCNGGSVTGTTLS